MKVSVLCCFLFLMAISVQDVRCHSVTCKNIGVFSREGPYHHWFLPNCPDDLNLKMALFTRSNPTKAALMHFKDVPSQFLKGVRTIFLIHGYAGSHPHWQDTTRLQLLKKGNFNVVEVYWDSGKLYQQSASDTRTVGAAVGVMSRHLAEQHGIIDLWCVGHSLGAHACGLAGKRFPKFMRITAMDPAGPMFRNNKKAGIEKSCAMYVDAIHTDGSLYGEMVSVGHTDFYVNGGKSQPGCFFHVCRHLRAIYLYTSSINAKKECLTTMHCTRRDKKLVGCKKAKGKQTLGYDSDLYKARGVFRIKSKSKKPFC